MIRNHIGAAHSRTAHSRHEATEEVTPRGRLADSDRPETIPAAPDICEVYMQFSLHSKTSYVQTGACSFGWIMNITDTTYAKS